MRAVVGNGRNRPTWRAAPIGYRARVFFGIRCFPGALFRACVACAVLGGLPISGGCSYIFVTPPRTEGYGIEVAADCTSNSVAPVIDTLLTSSNLISTLYVANESNVTNKSQAVGVGLLASGFWLSSAIYGFYNTSRCTALRDGDEGPYRRPARVRRTVLSGPRQPMTPPPPPPPALTPTPLSSPPPPYPSAGAGGAGGTAVPAAPSNMAVPAAPPNMAPAAPSNMAPAVPPVRQQLDEDDPGYRRQ